MDEITLKLTPEELFNDNKELAEITVKRMFPNYKAMAKKLGIEPDDFFQYANEGLWQASLQFDSEKGNRTFRNFAIYSIRWNLGKRIPKDCRIMSFQGIGRTGLDSKDIKSKLKFISLDDKAKDTEDGFTFHELIGNNYNLEGNAIGNVLVNWVGNKNSDRVNEIIRMKMNGMKNSEIGEVLGLSRERIRQLLKKVKLQMNGVVNN